MAISEDFNHTYLSLCVTLKLYKSLLPNYFFILKLFWFYFAVYQYNLPLRIDKISVP